MADVQDPHAGRVYVRRRGRMTAGQARALAQSDDDYRIDAHGLQHLAERSSAESSSAPIGLEIGFGMGQALVEWCQQAPDWQIIGIEVYQPGIGSAMLHAQEQGVRNLKIVEGDADLLLAQNAVRAWIGEVRIFFPDPWPKKRHHKRRLIQPPFLQTLVSCMLPQAVLRVATDWGPYAEQINTVLRGTAELANRGNAEGFAPRFAQRGTTRFEARGQRLGHETWDFLYQRI